jgi:hypothetical protein
MQSFSAIMKPPAWYAHAHARTRARTPARTSARTHARCCGRPAWTDRTYDRPTALVHWGYHWDSTLAAPHTDRPRRGAGLTGRTASPSPARSPAGGGFSVPQSPAGLHGMREASPYAEAPQSDRTHDRPRRSALADGAAPHTDRPAPTGYHAVWPARSDSDPDANTFEHSLNATALADTAPLMHGGLAVHHTERLASPSAFADRTTPHTDRPAYASQPRQGVLYAGTGADRTRPPAPHPEPLGAPPAPHGAHESAAFVASWWQRPAHGQPPQRGAAADRDERRPLLVRRD